MYAFSPRRTLRAMFVALALQIVPIAASAATSSASELLDNLNRVDTVDAPRLDFEKLAREDAPADLIGGGAQRFAIAHEVALTPDNSGTWTPRKDGTSLWRLQVRAIDAVHLNFGFSRFALPEGAELRLLSADGSFDMRYSVADMLPHGQLWTQIVPGQEAVIALTVPADARKRVALELAHINQGYRGFGFKSAACKSGACNMDVACLAAADPWNRPRRSVGAITRNGTDTCTGSLLNNTANDRRMLFATATHCGITSTAVAATVLVYWKYESATCRTPGSAASGTPLPKPSTTSAGVTFLAATNNPFGGGGAGNTRSDWALIELATPPTGNTFDLHWAGWDRRPAPVVCTSPADPTSNVGECASIHHPSVDEKRITFVQENMTVDNINSATGVHLRANWDPNPPILPNIPAPQPGSVPPGVTEPGSSGSPLYSSDQRIVGVLSGGPSACGATGTSLRDQYGALFHAFDGNGTSTTRMRDYLDPLSTGALFIDGIDAGPSELLFSNGFE